MASSNLLPRQILLLTAAYLPPQDQFSLLQVIPGIAKSFSPRHLRSRDENGNTLLHLLAQAGDSGVSLFTDLVASCRSADLHPQNHSGITPLMGAITVSNSTAIRLLIENDPDGLNVSDVEGATPLFYAVDHGITMAATLLLQQPSIDVSHRRDTSETPLLRAMHEQMRLEVTEELLRSQKTDLEEPDEDGNTPLMLAAFEGLEDQVRIILDRGVDINAVNNIGDSALMKAMSIGHTPVVELLLAQKGILVDQPDIHGETPLLYAARYRTDDLPLLVSRNDIDVNRTDHDGRSALCHAVRNRDLDAVKLLLARSDIVTDSVDCTGQSPLAYAQQDEQDEIARLLLEHGARYGLDDYLDKLIAQSAPPGGWWAQWR